MTRIVVRLVFPVAIGLCLVVLAEGVAQAQSFAWPQPVSGAQRGRVVFRRGPLGGIRYKSHYGQGFNEYGASVFNNLIDTAAEVFIAQTGGQPTESTDDRAARLARNRAAEQSDQDAQQAADDLRTRSRELAAEFEIPAAPGTTERREETWRRMLEQP